MPAIQAKMLHSMQKGETMSRRICTGIYRPFAVWLLLPLISLLASGAALEAASPDLRGLSPRGGQRGTELEVTLTGNRLDDAEELMFYGDGIEVTKFEVEQANRIKATFKIADDCRLGTHPLRLRTSTGISELAVFMVGALPMIEEKEPNNDFSNPQSIPMNVTVMGVADNEDVDYYVVEAKKGERITAEVEGIRLGISFFDPYVAILNEGRFEMAASDDNALVYQDSIASIIAPEDGKYIIEVRESSYAGNRNCQYRLHVGNFPRPLGVLPAGGKPGTKQDVQFVGDVNGPLAASVEIPQEEPFRFGLIAEDAKGVAPSPNVFRISDLDNVLEQEPNNTADNATKFTPPAALNGVISAPDEVDNFRFTAKKGQVYDVRVHARSIRSPLDSVLTISRANGQAVGSNDDAGGPDSYLRFTAPEDDDYIISIRDHLNEGGPEYVYRVEMTPVQPTLELSLAEFRRYFQPTIEIPRGNRFAVMVNASRKDFGGPLAIRAEDLPAGITVESPGMPANLNEVPVIFTAAPDAPVAGALARIIGALDDPNQKREVEGHVTQDVVLVRGQNQRPVWTESLDRVPVAVTEESPFELEVIEPKVPVVRGGTMELKVVAKRKEDFKAAIKLDMLWFPPGVNASRNVSIAEGKDEATLTVNAAGNARLEEWPIAVRGTADTGNGALMVCSELVKLRVAEQYLKFNFPKIAAEQGSEADLFIEVEKNTDFSGTAKVELLGLPAKVTAEPIEITSESDKLTFKVNIDPASPVGTHKNLLCRVTVIENDEPIVHSLGSGQLRIDKPLPPKTNEPEKPAQVAKKPEPEKPAEKPLSRLEQLRLEQKERQAAKSEESSK
jgi:hypothetical protein